VSLNHRRRIFRSANVPSLLRGIAGPTLGIGLAVAVGLLAISAGVWFVVRPAAAPAKSQTVTAIVGRADEVGVVDGGTLRVHDWVVHLDGISVPVRGEICRTQVGAQFDCGAAATNALAALVRGAAVNCAARMSKGSTRPGATCVSRGIELNGALVAQGWARADGSEPALLALESEARAARRGLWAGTAW
jgi:endonuclease YncB( thermonuclease family)